jgi:hypothetical protein
MMHRKRNLLTAVLAAAVLATLALSPAAAFGGPGSGLGGGRGGHDPSASPKVFPTAKPRPTLKVPNVPVGAIHIDCSVVPTPGTTPAPSATAAASPAVALTARELLELKRSTIAFRNGWVIEFCTIDSLRKSADSRIDAYVKQLNSLTLLVGKSSLSSGDQATLTGEINTAIGDLQTLKTKIDAETTVAGVQGDLATLAQDGRLVRGIRIQVQGILGALNLEAKAAKFDTLATTLQSQIDAAASGIDTATAQKFLDDLKARVANAKTRLGPVPGQLLTLTDAQLMNGKADPTLAAAFKALGMASFDLWIARHDSWMVQWILAGKPGFHVKPTPSPTVAPSATPAPTEAPTPTA